MENKKYLEKENVAEQGKYLDYLSHIRHDRLNHFQVLLGYLKLERYDLCEEYIRRITEDTNNESRVAALGKESLVTYLLMYNVVYKRLKIEVEVPEMIRLIEFDVATQVRIEQLVIQVIDTYEQYSLSNQGQINTLILHLKQVEYTLYISCEFEGDLSAEACLQDLRLLVGQWLHEEVFFVEGIHNEEESIMEFYVPLSIKKEVNE